MPVQTTNYEKLWSQAWTKNNSFATNIVSMLLLIDDHGSFGFENEKLRGMVLKLNNFSFKISGTEISAISS